MRLFNEGTDLTSRELKQQAFAAHSLNAQRIAQARYEATKIERRRIYQDLHDGVAARLVMTLYRLREGRLNNEQIEEALLASLNDIKKVVDFSDESVPIDIVSELFARCMEIEDFFADSNINFSYAIPADSGLSLLNQAGSDVLFIFQEIITNFLKHSLARQMHVSVTLEHGFCLSLQESIHPCDARYESANSTYTAKVSTLPRPASSGQGLNNIQMRAKAMGADFEIVQNEALRLTSLRLVW